jgi:hypothetical protein
MWVVARNNDRLNVLDYGGADTFCCGGEEAFSG